MWLILLVLIFLVGYSLLNIFFPERERWLVVSDSFIIGSVVSLPLFYFITSYIFGSLSVSFLVYGIFAVIFFLLNFKRDRLNFRDIKYFVVFFGIFSLTFLIFKRSFSYDLTTSEFLISSNIYLDFGAHIPFIRSFSLGNNFPFTIPFYANGHGVYYFMFNFYTGILEHFGLRIDNSLNMLSALSLTSLLSYIFVFSTRIFKNIWIGFLSTLFFIFPSNLSIISFINQNGVDLNLPLKIWRNSSYINNAPFDKSLIFNFFSMNTFMNQRHLIFGIAVTLFVFFNLWFIKKINLNQAIFFGLIIGFLYLWHGMLFIALMVLISGLFLFKQKREIFIVILTSVIVFLIQILIVGFPSNSLFSFRIGFLTEHFNLFDFIKFWFMNLGIIFFLVPVGLYLVHNGARKLFLIFFLLFLIPNIFTFSVRFDYDNHKFFNLWIIFIDFISAFAIYKISMVNRYFKVLSLILVVIFISSGVMNNLVIKNDVYARIPDYKVNNLMKTALYSLSPEDVILTNGEIYDPMSLIGKKIFIGRAHYLYVYGEDPFLRVTEREIVLNGVDKVKINNILKKNKIKYVVIYKNGFAKNEIDYNPKFFKQFKKLYEDKNGFIFEI